MQIKAMDGISKNQPERVPIMSSISSVTGGLFMRPIAMSRPQQSPFTSQTASAKDDLQSTQQAVTFSPSFDRKIPQTTIMGLGGIIIPRADLSTASHYDIPEGPSPYLLSHKNEGGIVTSYPNFPGGTKATAGELRKTLNPSEFNMALVAAAEADNRGLGDEFLAAINTLETELEGTFIPPTPLDEREWVQELMANPEKFGLEWVMPREEWEADLQQRKVNAVPADAITFTPREDFLRIAVEAEDNIQVLLDVVNNLEGEERAQVLHEVAGNHDWAQMKDHLRNIVDKTPDEALEYVIHTLEEAVSPSSGLFPLRPKNLDQIKPAEEYIGPRVDTKV